MNLDPDIARFLAAIPAGDAEDRALFNAARARQASAAVLGTLNEGRAGAFAVETRDIVVGRRSSLPSRLYTPSDGLLDHPGIVYFHGGGWVIGGVATHDIYCRRLAAETSAAVLAVDYRLAPEHLFPAANDNAVDALQHVLAGPQHFRMAKGRVGVAGDSAGAILATAAARTLHLAGEDVPAFQLLICPGGDVEGSYASRERFGSGYFFSTAEMQLFACLYAPAEADRLDPRVSPLRAHDLSGLPPAIVVTAGFDPLQDEGAAYANALERDGVEVQRLHEPAMIHAFILLDALGPGVSRATERVSNVLRVWLAGQRNALGGPA